MKILFCCEFYAPSIGGVQEVMRQIAEHLVLRGHDVTVATTSLAMRDFDVLNGVKIKGFDVSGNLVRGMIGELNAYRDYVITGDFDVVMIKAAQQWTFDALWPVLDQITTPKVFIPCGFSGLYEPAYKNYFEQLPEILKKIDHLIFYATDYRDINFTKKHGLNNFSIIPNGASEIEFSIAQDPHFRIRHGISETDLLFLTVGSFTGLKGHLEVVKAFAEFKTQGHGATLILNGNECHAIGEKANGPIVGLLRNVVGLVRIYGLRYALKHVFKKILWGAGIMIGKSSTPEEIAAVINQNQTDKKVLITNYPRQELVQAFMAADLFVFASNVEYSPLVLFETAAAGTPFLSVNVGNAKEIAEWTGAGEICPSTVDGKGYTRVEPCVLAEYMANMVNNSEKLEELGSKGKQNWANQFTWEKIARRYENIFLQLSKGAFPRDALHKSPNL